MGKPTPNPGAEAPSVTRDGTWDGTWASGFFQSPLGSEPAANRSVPDSRAAGDAPCLPQPAGVGGQKQPQREAEGPTARRAVLSCGSPCAGTRVELSVTRHSTLPGACRPSELSDPVLELGSARGIGFRWDLPPASAPTCPLAKALPQLSVHSEAYPHVQVGGSRLSSGVVPGSHPGGRGRCTGLSSVHTAASVGCEERRGVGRAVTLAWAG